MSGFILHDGALINCPHLPGVATPTTTDPRVSVSGQPVMTVMRFYKFAACSNTNAPCLVGEWTLGAQRVTASGLAVAIDSGVSKIDPPGQLAPFLFQRRVTAS